MQSLIQRVEADLSGRGLVRRGQALLVGVSGGLDSMALLAVLRRLARAWDWRLVVAHFNHQLRGSASEGDQALVARTARRWGLACEAGRADVRARATAHGLSLEMAARAARHEFFAAAARRRRLRTVALAHHADDQVELFLVRLLRGAGSLGLAGMRWLSPSPADAAVQLLRPFLGVSREELEEFVRAERIPFRTDASNASHDIFRNRIRHELLPLLTRRYQPAVRTVILREMAALGAEADLVSELAERWRAGGGLVPFRELSPAVQRRVLQEELSRGGWEVDFDRVEALRTRPGTVLTLAADTHVRHDGAGRIERLTSAPAGFDHQEMPVELAGRRGAGEFAGLAWAWNHALARGRALPKFQPGCEWFDAEKVGEQVILRHWRPGDRFQPAGLSSAVKLQDLFVNRKVPQPLRHRLVVAATTAGELWWVEGMRIAEKFKLGPKTRRRLRWAWVRKF